MFALQFLAFCSCVIMNNAELQLQDIQDRCTTIIVGKDAGTEGPMLSHTADCNNCDFRISKVPAADWDPNSLRPIYRYRNTYPATISSDRGATWLPSNLQGTPEQLAAWGNESNIVTHIPQVEHTYALYEAGYGIMNEFQVAIGESTSAARYYGIPMNAGLDDAHAGIDVNEMSRLALERTTTAKEAILLMGQMAVDLGYYGADWGGGDGSLGEAGEALTVIDPDDSWVFHVLGDDTGKSAVWVAQRVPPGHVTVVANQFTIRSVIPDSEDMLYSANIFDVAKRTNLWRGEATDGYLNFAQVFGMPRAHSPYALHRMWRVMSLVAPSLNLQPEFVDHWGSNYPWSVKAEKKLSPRDIMKIHSDHYEGSQFDLTKGLAAGPFGDPDRFDPAAVYNMTWVEAISGSYERAISMSRTSYSMIAQARGNYPNMVGGRIWFCPSYSRSGVYIPLYVAAESIPKPYTHGSLFKYDPDVAYWSFNSLGNHAARFYRFAMVDVFAKQKQLQDSIEALATSQDDAAVAMIDSSKLSGGGLLGFGGFDQATSGPSVEDATVSVSKLYTMFQTEQSDVIMSTWKELFQFIMTKYHDGAIARNLNGTEIVMEKMFYPKWWLNATGYFNNHPDFGPNTLLFASNPDANADIVEGGGSITHTSALLITLCGMLCTLGLGMYIGRVHLTKSPHNRDYMVIDNDNL